MFHEEWYSEPQCRLLADLARTVLPLEGIIMEIGCWEGRSTVALANAVYPQTLHAVDTWQGNFDESPDNISVLLAIERDIFKEFQTNISELTKGNVIPHKMDCFVYLANLQEKIKICHVDACHDYASVKQTIRMIMPKLVDGGVICGDDFCAAHAGRDDLQGGVEKAVVEMCPGFKADANSWWYRKGNIIHDRSC